MIEFVGIKRMPSGNCKCAACGRYQAGHKQQPFTVYLKKTEESRGHRIPVCSKECAILYIETQGWEWKQPEAGDLEDTAIRIAEELGADYLADIQEDIEAIHYDPEGVTVYDIEQLKEVRGLLKQAQERLAQIKKNIEEANRQPEERRNENERI